MKTAPLPLEASIMDHAQQAHILTCTRAGIETYGDERVRAALEEAIEICEADGVPVAVGLQIARRLKGLMP